MAEGLLPAGRPWAAGPDTGEEEVLPEMTSHVADRPWAESGEAEYATDPSVVAELGETRLIPVLRCKTAPECIDLAARLLESGLSLVEVAATTPNWPEVVSETRRRFPKATVGVGTILTSTGAELAVSYGARFLVCPTVDDSLRRGFGRYLIEGGLTPGEVHRAGRFGLAKLFPAHVGGPQYLRSLLAVFPDLNIMPTGGLALSSTAEWLSAGAFAVGVGSGLSELPDPAGAIRDVLSAF